MQVFYKIYEKKTNVQICKRVNRISSVYSFVRLINGHPIAQKLKIPYGIASLTAGVT